MEIEEGNRDECDSEETGEESHLPMIRNLLKRYKVFGMPKKLPPRRAVDHRMLTVDG